MKASNLFYRSSFCFLLVGISCLLCQCHSSFSSGKEYEKWLQDPQNGLLKTVKMGAYTFRLQYEPAPYVLLKRYKGKLPAKDQYERELGELTGSSFFTLLIEMDKGNITQSENPLEYQQKLQYYSFAMQNDLFLEYNGKKQACGLYYFDNMQNQLGNQARFILGFQDLKPTSDQTLCIDSEELGVGIVKFHISSKDIQEIPAFRHS